MVTFQRMAIGIVVALLVGYATASDTKPAEAHVDIAGASTYQNDTATAASIIFHLAKFDYPENFAIRPDYGQQVLLRYVDALDPEHIFFSSEDVATITAPGNAAVSLIQSSNATMAMDIAQKHADRVNMRINYALGLLNKGFQFSGDDSLVVKAASAPDFLPEQALKARWEKIVKSDWLNLKLQGLSDSQIKDQLTSRYSHFSAALIRADQTSVLVRYVAACIAAGDPSGAYWNGAYLEKSTDLPAYAGMLALTDDADGPLIHKEGNDKPTDALHAGDRLIGVSTETGPITYLDGTNAVAAAALVRSLPQGAGVNLYVRRAGTLPGAPIIKVSYTSALASFDDKITMQLITPANSENNARVAFVSIPSMYGFTLRAGDRATSQERADVDLRHALEQAREQGAVAVVLDLRGDGGGYFNTVDRIAGLFLGNRSPWRTQHRSGTGDMTVTPMDPVSDASIAWDGALVVLVDGRTAEGGEILAGALQDYGRALIVGNRTVANGSVQSSIDLNRFVSTTSTKAATDLGLLKMTTMGVFRANGESLSGHGITPDVTLPQLVPRGEFERQPAPSIAPATIDRFTSYDASYAEVMGKYRHIEGRSPDIARWLAESHRLEPDGQLGDELSLNLTQRLSEHRAATSKSVLTGPDPVLETVAEIAYDQSRALMAQAQQKAGQQRL
jgi:carboxyl-terminal processing protease